MMHPNQRLLLLMMLCFACFQGLGQASKRKLLSISEVAVESSFSAVADEAVFGIGLAAHRDLWSWRFGRFYAGTGAFYGSFPNTSKQINPYLEGKTRLVQPLQAIGGHQFALFNKRLLFRSAILFGPSLFQQQVAHRDSRFDIDREYRYHAWHFTMHSQVGMGLRIGQRLSLETFVKLPIITRNIAPLGAGLMISKRF